MKIEEQTCSGKGPVDERGGVRSRRDAVTTKPLLISILETSDVRQAVKKIFYISIELL